MDRLFLCTENVYREQVVCFFQFFFQQCAHQRAQPIPLHLGGANAQDDQRPGVIDGRQKLCQKTGQRRGVRAAARDIKNRVCIHKIPPNISKHCFTHIIACKVRFISLV